jgi:fructuronate reductase
MTERPDRHRGSTIVHLGVGAFHRAHQAWYTHRASTSDDPWSIVAFTGRSPEQARLLQASGGSYTLITRGPDGDRFERIDSIRSAHDGADRPAWEQAVGAPDTRLITLTVTEAGYRADVHGNLDLADAAVVADLRAARSGADAALATAPVRLASGLAARRSADAGPLTVISCDNLPGNGAITRAVVLQAAAELDPALPAWIDANVGFRSSMVDRITPRTVPADIDAVERATGIRDEAAVVTEPFSEWIIERGFTGPDWERADVRLTDDLAPYEERKLRILNGAHSLLAYRGLLAGHEHVADAFADPAVHEQVEEYWASAAESCSLPRPELDEAVDATRGRFANPRIRHALAQIALDGEIKLRHRVVPVLAHAVRSGGSASAPASAIAAWMRWSGASGHALDGLLTGHDADVAAAMRAAIEREIRRLGEMSAGAVPRAGAVRS